MHNLKAAIIFMAAMFGLVPAAVATGGNSCGYPSPTYDRYCGDPDIATAVLPQQTSVTFGTDTPPQSSLATYRVTLTHYNARTELLKPVTIKLSTNVVGADGTTIDATLSAKITAVVGSTSTSMASGWVGTCVADTPTSMTCTYTGAEFNAPGEVITYDVTVEAPTVPSPAPTESRQIRLTANTSWQEPGECYYATPDPRCRTDVEIPRSGLTPLDIPADNQVKSFVPAGGGTLFTVNPTCEASSAYLGCPATPEDTWTTTVTLPQASQSTTASVAETVSPVTCAANLLTCSTSTLTIPGTFANLTIILRRDATTIAKKAKIASARVFYDNPANADPRVVYPLEVPPCSDTTYGPLPQSGIPCIASRKDYPDKSTPKKPVPPGFEGDWEFVIYALDNGKYQN